MSDLYRDPEFLKLSPEAKMAVMSKLDRDFAALSPEAKTAVIGKFSGPPASPETMQEVSSSLGKQAWDIASPIISEGGPVAVGTTIGGALGGPPGAVLGGLITEGGRQAFRRFAGPNELAPQSLPAAYTEQVMAGVGGLLSPEAAAAKYPLAAQGGKFDSVIPPKMKYGEAKNTLESLPVSKVLKEAEFSQQRAAAAQAMREQKALAQSEFNKRVSEGLEPLRQEKNRIMNQRGQRSAELAQQRTATTENLRDSLRTLKETTTLAKESATKQAADDASLFVKSVGREMTKTEIAEGTLQARKMGWQAYTDREVKLYKEIKEDIFPKNPVEVKTGKMIETGEKDISGKPIMKEETKLIAGGIDRSALKDKLRPLAEQYREELTAARQNGSPGAAAILQIVDGPDVVSGAAALDDLAALNKFGYSRADAVIRTQGEAVTRKVASEYRDTIRTAIEKMKDGDRALKNLDEARILISKRDEIYKVGEGVKTGKPVAKTLGESVSRTGNVYRVINDPIGMKALYAEVDDATREGMKRQVSELTLGKNPSDFAKNWAKLDPEVKAINFTPQQIARADELAARGPQALADIAAAEMRTNTQLIKNATAKIRQIGDERMLLAEKPAEVRALETKIRLEKDAARKEQMKRSLEIMQKASESRKAIAEQQAMYRQGYEIQMRQAQNRVKEVEAALKKIKIGAGIVGTGVVTDWTFNKVAPLLGWSTP